MTPVQPLSGGPNHEDMAKALLKKLLKTYHNLADRTDREKSWAAPAKALKHSSETSMFVLLSASHSNRIANASIWCFWFGLATEVTCFGKSGVLCDLQSFSVSKDGQK